MSLPSELNEVRLLASLAFNWFRHHWRPFVTLQALLLLAIWVAVHPYDHVLLESLRAHPVGVAPEQASSVAGWLSRWGDFPGFNVVLALGLWLAGLVCHRPAWRRLALITVLSAAMAGLTTNLLRSSLGRSRPYSKQTDAFYGPHFTHEFQSCPSGHTTTAFGAAIPLLIAAPPMGVATTIIAGSVAWSRMYLNRHYPADIAMGIWMALWFAVPFGFAARARRICDKTPTT